MKKVITLFFILFLSSISLAQTNVSGNQSGVWDLVSSPYLVTGHITIPAGQTLDIEPGVEVRFQGYFKFNVLGNLQAIGTENAPVLFTAENHETGWGGLRVDSNDLIKLKYCRVEYGFSSGEYPDTHGGGMALIGSNALIENCIFADNSTDTNGMGGAIYATGSTGATNIVNSTFIRNNAYGEGGAIKFTGGSNVKITNNKFFQNDCQYGGGALTFYSTYGAMVKGNIFVDNYTLFSDGGAIQALGIGTRLYFVNNTLTNNHAVTGDGGAISLHYTDAYFVNNIVFNNPGNYSDDVYVGFTSNAEIYYSNLPMPDNATGDHNINTDPQFVDVENYDLSLSDSSQSIDSGIAYLQAGGVTLVDMGIGEYHGKSPDMGAIESAPPLIFKNGFE